MHSQVVLGELFEVLVVALVQLLRGQIVVAVQLDPLQILLVIRSPVEHDQGARVKEPPDLAIGRSHMDLVVDITGLDGETNRNIVWRRQHGRPERQLALARLMVS